MAKSMLLALAACIGLYFMYSGFCKMSPSLNEDLHGAMKKHFVNYARVAPLRTRHNIRFKGMDYRKFIAGLEITGGGGLLAMSGRNTRTLSYIILLTCVGAMLHTYYMLGDPVTKVYTLLVSGAVVLVQMLIEIRANKNANTTKKEKSS